MSQTNLVHRTNKTIYTDSLIVASEFGKAHDKLCSKIKSMIESEDDEIREFSLANFGGSDFITDRGKSYQKYEITEDGFLELAMSFTGDKARKIRVRFIKAFRTLLESYSEPQRTAIIKDKRQSHAPMMTALEEFRADLGKETREDNYMAENKLCNFMVVGRYIGVCQLGGEDGLTNYEIELLAQVRKRNEAYILSGLAYQDRKKKLIEFSKKYRSVHIDPSPRPPLLALVD